MKRRVQCLVAFAAAAVMAPAAAFAHAELVSSIPAQNGALPAGAKEISLTFDEAVKPVSCKVTDDAGKEADVVGKPTAKGENLRVPLKAVLPAGKYSLTCRVVGPDSHAVNDSLKFVVN